MFEELSEKLDSVLGALRQRGVLTDPMIREGLREVRRVLLEADVHYKVAKDFLERVQARALGDEVIKSITPGQQVVKITNEEITSILGGESGRMPTPTRKPGVILMVGLNGSGKTTTAAKLARYLKQSGQPPVLVAADLHRPAAIKQLETLGSQVGVDVYTAPGARSAADVARDGVRAAAKANATWAVVDTAGRFQLDDELMAELEDIRNAVSPDETLLVADAMTGQDAVSSAGEFNERIGLSGLVLTKLDGDARGGAALSITSVTGVPIRFLGVGERVDALEQFHPDRLASRILGMGDMLTLIEKAQTTFDRDEAVEMEKKIRQATFDLEDFLGQLQQLKTMGPISQILELVPGLSGVRGRVSEDDLDDGHLKKAEAVIRSMTPQERQNPRIIGGSRRRRIARGSGTRPQDVNMLLNQFRQMQKMMRQMTSGKGQRKMEQMLQQRGGPFPL
jgi:signal recognition particle subunit SRP54